MHQDKFGNNIYQEKDLINLIYSNNIESLDQVLVEETNSTKQFEYFSQLELKKPDVSMYEIDIDTFDKICQDDWFIPDNYKVFDVEGYLVHVCPKENYQRLIEELNEYKTRNLLSLLRCLKYLVDTMREHNIVWGVGRGSSVSSYVLFLLGVHKIDSIKYNLDWREFLR